MPATPHTEKHFTASQSVRDVVIGMADGLTVPFALAAGLTGAAATNHIIVTAGLAEIAAGSIAMGLGGYLAAKTDLEHYRSERERELRETVEKPQQESEEVAAIFREYGLSEEQIAPVLQKFRAKPAQWVDFMMRFELGLEAPDAKRARRSAATIDASYVVSGLVPLFPYILLNDLRTALIASAAMTAIALLIFGYVKAIFTGIRPIKGAIQTALVGAIAAAAAFVIARAIAH